MEIALVCIATFIASGVTFFSGFGLGTILMPVVAIFLPVPIAIAVTAFVHFMNKIFKVFFLWRYIDLRVAAIFGIPALLAAIPGALLLHHLSNLHALVNYMLFGSIHFILPIKLTAGLLLIFFAAAEDTLLFKNNALSRLGLAFGGLLSGFFGGLTGHQGAFRSAFLVQNNLSEKSFIATNAAIAVLVDATRLVVYGLTFDLLSLKPETMLVLSATASSLAGVYLGTLLLKKATIDFIRNLVATMMYLIGALLCAGLI